MIKIKNTDTNILVSLNKINIQNFNSCPVEFVIYTH